MFTHLFAASTAWDVSFATYTGKSFSTTNEDTYPQDVEFNDDGTIMYIMGFFTTRVYQYTLSTAWDVSTASYASKNAYVGGQTTAPYSVAFSTDGTKMYIAEIANQRIYQYTLSTPWDVSTASYASKLFDPEGLANFAIHFKPDGTKVYINSNSTDLIYQYSLSVAWDISTASYDSLNFDYSNEESDVQGVYIKPDGTQLYVTGNANDTVYQYALLVAWDISSAVYRSQFYDPISPTNGSSVHFRSDGVYCYMTGGSFDNSVYQHILK